MLKKILSLSVTATLLFLSGCVERGFELTVNQRTHTVTAQKTIDLRATQQTIPDAAMQEMQTAVQKEQKREIKKHTTSLHKPKKSKHPKRDKETTQSQKRAAAKALQAQKAKQLAFKKEQERIANEAKRQRTLLAQKLAKENEAKRVAAQKEKARLAQQAAAQKAALERRIAQEKAAQARKAAQEKAALARKLAAQKAAQARKAQAEAQRVAAQKEKARLAKEAAAQKAALERKIAQEKAAQARKAAEEKAALARKLAAQKAAQIAKQKAAQAAQIARQKAQEAALARKLAAQKAAQARKEKQEKEALARALKKEQEAEARKKAQAQKTAPTHAKTGVLHFSPSTQTYQKFGTSEIHGHVVYLTPSGAEIVLKNTKIYLVPKNTKTDYWYKHLYLQNKTHTAQNNINMAYINATHLNAEQNFAFYGLATGRYYVIIESTYPPSIAKNKKVYIAKEIKVERYKKIMTVFSKKL